MARKVMKRYRPMAVTENMNVAPIDVDDLDRDDSITIEPGDAILWFSGLGDQFRISRLEQTGGPGPEQPFPHDLPAQAKFRDHVASGPARRCVKDGQRTYKYAVLFEDGRDLDPTVIIQQ